MSENFSLVEFESLEDAKDALVKVIFSNFLLFVFRMCE
jgi:hypothetical protein